jgi:hypothetical protein
MSQFASLFKTDVKEKAETKIETKPKSKPAKKKLSVSPAPHIEEPPPVKSEKRQTGKSSNPDYAQVLTYIRRDTHNSVRAALIFDDQKRDLSDLVEELLADWLKNNSR